MAETEVDRFDVENPQMALPPSAISTLRTRETPPQPVFLLSPEAQEAAKQLVKPTYTDGTLIYGNCSPELIGSSPLGLGNIVYPETTVTWTQHPGGKGLVLVDRSRIWQMADPSSNTARSGYLENMYTQIVQGVPGMVLDTAAEKVIGDLDSISPETASRVEFDFAAVFQELPFDDTEILKILEKYAMTEAFASGLYCLYDSGSGVQAAAAKGQSTGVVTFGLKVTDRKLKPIIHHPQYNIVAKALMLKTEWQRRMLLAINPNVRMNADEPYLVSAWSQQMGLKGETILGLLHTQQAVLGPNGGVHCCGITDYQALLESGTKVVELDLTGDAFDGSWESANYAQRFVGVAPYDDGLQRFLNKHGQLGLGIVPFNENVSAAEITQLGLRILEELKQKGVTVDPRQLIITPVCGAGSETLEKAADAFNKLPLVCRQMQRELGIK